MPQIINVLSWSAPPRVFAYCYPDCVLTHKSQLIVEEAQEAVLVKEGHYYGPIEPGRHTLDTKNLPVLTAFFSSFSASVQVSYSASVWFVKKSVPLNIKWGTPSPIQLEDPKYHILLPVRAFGQYGIQIVDSCRFLARLNGTMPAFTEPLLADFFKGIIATRTKDLLAQAIVKEGCSIFDVGARLKQLSASLGESLSGELAEYGVALRNFTIGAISTDDSDPSVIRLKDALAKKAAMSILGTNYEQARSFDTLQTAAGNTGSAGAMMGVGLGLGMGTGAAAPLGGAVAAMAQNVNPGGAKFCAACGGRLPSGAKFCPACGAKQE